MECLQFYLVYVVFEFLNLENNPILFLISCIYVLAMLRFLISVYYGFSIELFCRFSHCVGAVFVLRLPCTISVLFYALFPFCYILLSDKVGFLYLFYR